MKQDITLNFPNRSFSCNIGYILFDTDDYNTRLYCFEQDLNFTYSLPSYYYKGERAYGVFKYNINSWLAGELKISETVKDISGKTECTVQFSGSF